MTKRENINRKIKLEIGCGKNPRIDYITCDIRDLPEVDFICNSNNLPFGNEEVDEVYSRHVVEHFTIKEFLEVLEEWNRVLKVGGEVYIICPNLLWHLEQILKGDHQSLYNKKSGQNDRYWGFGSLFGWQENKYDIHKFGYYFHLLKDILEEFGFDNVENLTNSGKGLENEPWHLEIRARKIKKAPDYRKAQLFNHFDVKH